MILVDTSVWIDFLAGKDTQHRHIIAAIAQENDSVLLHNDNDFAIIEKCIGLKSFKI
jgi:predicted nucleic acid-binding protein